MRTILAIVLWALSTYAAAQFVDLPIRFDYLKPTDPRENSALSGQCDGNQRSAEITCRFTQVAVRRALDPKEVVGRTQEMLAQFRQEVKKKGFKRIADDMCLDAKERSQLVGELTTKGADRDLAEVQDYLKMCEQPTVANFEQFLRRSIEVEAKTCKVSFFQNDPVKYRRVSATRWVSNDGPKGPCSAVYLYALDRHDKQENLWRWTQTRTYADTSSKYCKDTEIGKKLEFSWDGFDPQFSCERISFGSF